MGALIHQDSVPQNRQVPYIVKITSFLVEAHTFRVLMQHNKCEGILKSACVLADLQARQRVGQGQLQATAMWSGMGCRVCNNEAWVPPLIPFAKISRIHLAVKEQHSFLKVLYWEYS